MKFEPVYLAIILCAFAVVALWQPYFHVEERRNLLATAYGFSTYEAAENIQSQIKFGRVTVEKITKNPEHNLYPSGLINGEWKHWVTVESTTWDVSWYSVDFVTVYDEVNLIGGLGSGRLPKLFWASLFMVIISLLIIIDSRIKAANQNGTGIKKKEENVDE